LKVISFDGTDSYVHRWGWASATGNVAYARRAETSPRCASVTHQVTQIFCHHNSAHCTWSKRDTETHAWPAPPLYCRLCQAASTKRACSILLCTLREDMHPTHTNGKTTCRAYTAHTAWIKSLPCLVCKSPERWWPSSTGRLTQASRGPSHQGHNSFPYQACAPVSPASDWLCVSAWKQQP